ncbi:hypothetical protein LSTR_LSTR016491, partial [Laodelphax striatellus]
PSKKEHETFLKEVITLCDSPDAQLLKQPCYKNIGSLIPFRRAAMRALAVCHYIPGYSERIFATLYNALSRPEPELQQAAFECMRTFVSGSTIDTNK